LFDAVQFVLLSPKFYTLRTEERQALLHEGSGSAAVNAFVELVFDNSDGRLSVESDEVIVRRTVGHKKDEYFLQRKRANKNEIMSLLEGAGFSKSNPYFIVQQGKVNALCTMSDGERLMLLKEVAGTTVYDEKKAESLAKMDENKSSIEKIDDILSEIESRLAELQDEKEELTQYQKLDRDRRAVEYTLYDKELRRARETLDDIEHVRSEGCKELSILHEEARMAHDAIRTVEARMKTKTNALRRNRVYLQEMERDKTEAMTHRTKVELECKELEEGIKTGKDIIKANKRKIEELNVEIAKVTKELEQNVGPKCDSARETLTHTINERDEARKKMEGLYAKQGRGQQSRNKRDRDAHLRAQIKELNETKKEKETFLVHSQEKLSNLRRSVTTDTSSLEKKTTDVTKKNSMLESLCKSIEEKTKERNDMAEARKEQWRSLEEINEQTNEARDASKRALSDMRKIMPRATAMGLDALTNIVEEERIVVGEQYFGLLLQNMEITNPKFETAVEVAAQNSLFHVIVDTDHTAARLMKRLEKDRLGRVTFLPLNQLHVDKARYPDSSDVTPLLSQCIQYDPRVERAMQHVFGKKLLARNVDVASTWSARCGMDAITLEGDLCSRKGAMSGGYIDLSKSRIRAHQSLRSSEERYKTLEDQRLEMQRKATAVDQQVSNLMAEVQRLEAKRANLEHIINRTDDEIVVIQKRLDTHNSQLKKTETEIIPPIHVETRSLDSQIELLEEEMGTELSDTLSEEEQDMLKQLKKTQSDLEIEMEKQTHTLEEISVERERLQSLLEDNLLKKLRELEEENSGTSSLGRRSKGKSAAENTAAAMAKRQEDLEQRQRELIDATKASEEIEAKLNEAKKEDGGLRSELIAEKNELEKLKLQDMNNQASLEKAQENAEKLLNKRSMCVSKRELYMRKIQELGSLPPTSELSTFTSLSITALMRQLESTNKKLKKYSHVNKKAYDQYVNFSEQRESLLKRKEELDRGAEKVKELVESLDRKKDEAINRTFRGVSAHFKDVFKELVPNGAGEVIMRTALDEEGADAEMEDSDESDEEDAQEGKGKGKGKKPKKKKSTKGNMPDPSNLSVNMYRGIGIKVRFSRVGENYLMSQLSGGQKALVALALIFAIQRCDPAPFYLFDELDQALDSTYRAAVAALIQRQANSDENPTQFVCSTFRPELVAVANRCYGISHQNKVSNIHVLSKKDALHFIANLMNEEEAVGEVTSLATTKASRPESGASRSSRKRKAAVKSDEALEEEVAA